MPLIEPHEAIGMLFAVQVAYVVSDELSVASVVTLEWDRYQPRISPTPR
jgi:hypothetical protein